MTRAALLAVFLVGCGGGEATASATLDAPPEARDVAATPLEVDAGDAAETRAPTAAFVRVTADGFSPSLVRVHVGDSIVWTVDVDAPSRSTVSSGFECMSDELFFSAELSPGDVYRVRIMRAGPYPYFDGFDCARAGAVDVER